MFSTVNCREFFFMNCKLWKLLGIIWYQKSPDNADVRQPRSEHLKHVMWSSFINITVTCLFPLHLFLAIFNPAANKSDLFESIAIFSTSLGAASKLVLFAFNMKNVTKMEKILEVLDKRVQQQEDKMYFEQHIKCNLILMERIYVVVYACIGFFAILAFLVRGGEQKLIYPGWLPFDWHQSWRHFSAAVCFQMYGIAFQIMQNLSSDSFLSKSLSVLAAHVKFLYKRMARVGYDESLTLADHERELIECILQQKDLYE